MTTRQKTIQYAFPMLASASDAVVTNFTQITVYIPETVVAFRSCFIEFGSQDIVTATGGTITEWRVGFRLGAAGYTTATELNDLTNSGENLATMFLVDMTSHFTTNWTGTSMTADCQVYIDQSTGTTLGQRNCTAILYITYDYDDTATTHIKTVMLPLDSPTSNLQIALTEIGTNQVPNLDSLLPETSKTYRDIFFVIDVNESAAGGTTDFTMGASLDAEAEAAFGTTERGLGSDRFVRFVWRRTDMTTNATHAFKLRCAATSAFNHASITLVVTYEFASSSTSAMVSVQIPFEIPSPLGGTTSSDVSSVSRELWIEEDATIAIAHSASRMYFNTAAVITGLNVRTNNEGSTTQNYQAYTNNATFVCGCMVLQRRFDSAVSLARGRNTLVFEAYRTDTTDLCWNVSGLMLINYTCTVPSAGHGAMNKTARKLIQASNGAAAATSRLQTTTNLIDIPETNWFASSIGAIWNIMSSGTGAISGLNLICERGSGGWFGLYTDLAVGDPEVGNFIVCAAFRNEFQRWANDPDTDRSNPENNRSWRMTTTPATCFHSLIGLVTYHSITFTVAGTATGYADADGAGLTAEIMRADTGEIIGSVTTTTGGDYTFTWYDDTENVFVSLYENSTHVGRSAPTTAV